jgi:hypothetical protein
MMTTAEFHRHEHDRLLALKMFWIQRAAEAGNEFDYDWCTTQLSSVSNRLERLERIMKGRGLLARIGAWIARVLGA